MITIGTVCIVQTRMQSAKREYYVLYLICVALCELGYLLEMMADSTGGGFSAIKVFYLGVQFIMPFYLIFLQKYYGITLKVVNVLIFAVSAFIVLLVWTSDWHNLIYTSYWFDEMSAIHRLAVETGPHYPLTFIHGILCVGLPVWIIRQKMFTSWSHGRAGVTGRYRRGEAAFPRSGNREVTGRYRRGEAAFPRSGNREQRFLLSGQPGKEKRGTYWLLLFMSVSPFCAFLLYVFKINVYGADVAVALFIIIVMSVYFAVFKLDLMENEDTVCAQNWLREMVGNISHEMKTPLTVIAADIQLAEKFVDAGNIGDAKELMQEAWEETMQTANLVSGTLSFSRNRGTPKPMEKFNSGAIIEATLSIFEPLIKNHGNTLVRDIAKPAPIYGNADMLSSALINLLSNSKRHTNGGVIKVGWIIDGEGYHLTVRDNGSGISPEIFPRVFERGVSGGNSTGLGLAIVKNVTELHNGTVAIESEQGKGTAVTLTFPITEERRE
jgi:signal transduction histidine kinase